MNFIGFFSPSYCVYLFISFELFLEQFNMRSSKVHLQLHICRGVLDGDDDDDDAERRQRLDDDDKNWLFPIESFK